MSPEKKQNVIQAVISAIISILTALLAASCTIAIAGGTPFGSLVA